MKGLKRIFDFYLNASIHVALAVVALSCISSLTLNIPVNKHLLFFLFLGTISCYNFIKYGVEAKKYILLVHKPHKSIQLFSLICLVGAVFHAYSLPRTVWFAIGFLSVLTGLYALPLWPRAKNIRNWGGLKMVVVALVWAGATVILPVLSVNGVLSWDVGVETVQRFLFVWVLLVPFEIRDLAYDPPELKTIPQRFGITKTKIIGAFMTLFFYFFTFLKDDVSFPEVISKGVLFLCLGILMFVTKRKQTAYFASFWVEGIPIVWCALLYTLLRVF